jgi:hypothetical protein
MRTRRLIILPLLWLPPSLHAAALDLAEVRRDCRRAAIEDDVMADDLDEVVRECVGCAMVSLDSDREGSAANGEPIDPEVADALNDHMADDPGNSAGSLQYDDDSPDLLEVPPEGDQEPASLDN